MILDIVNESGYALAYATDGSIGLDLRACMSSPERWIDPGRWFKFDTGIRIALPDGYGAFVQPRSGLGLHHGVVAQTGTIDRDYTGRIGVTLFNYSREAYKVLPGDRIAQLVIVRAERAELREWSELEPTTRGCSGFGSTGR